MLARECRYVKGKAGKIPHVANFSTTIRARLSVFASALPRSSSNVALPAAKYARLCDDSAPITHRAPNQRLQQRRASGHGLPILLAGRAEVDDIGARKVGAQR